MALGLGVERQPVDGLQHVAQNVARAELVAQFGEDLADLVLDRLEAGGGLAEVGKIGEELLIDELDQVVADTGGVVVKLAVRLGRGPFVPAMCAVDDRGVIVAIEFGSVAAFSLEVVQVFEEQDSGRLFDVVQFVGNAVLVPKLPLDLVECVSVQSLPLTDLASKSHCRNQ